MMNLSASYNDTVVGCGSPIFRRLQKERGIMLTLAPKSHKDLPMNSFPIVQGIVILPGSLSFWGSLFWMTALHSSLIGMVSWSSHFHYVKWCLLRILHRQALCWSHPKLVCWAWVVGMPLKTSQSACHVCHVCSFVAFEGRVVVEWNF